MAKTKELAVVASDEQLALLAQELPQEAGYTRLMLPRFGMVSQDKLEEVGTGKNKTFKLVAAEGTFYTDRETDETVVREDGTEGKEWKKEYIEDENPEIIILFQRKQLRYYDSAEDKYTSSPIFDRDDEEVVLFKDRQEVARGTIAELKALYPGLPNKKGQPTSLLKDEKILYVLYKGEMMQFGFHGTSLWSFENYKRKVAVGTVLTRLGSEHMENGDTKWGKTTFTAVRPLTAEEATLALEKIAEIKEAIASEKAYFAGQSISAPSTLDKQFEALTAPEQKVF